MQMVLKDLKNKLTMPLVPIYLYFETPFIVETDVSYVALGFFLA